MYGNNFFNPYMYQPTYQAANFARGLGSINGANGLGRMATSLGNNSAGLSGIKGLLGKFSFSGFLNGASKTLNVVNQAIPIFYQVKPIINNAKTMFRIMGAVKDDGTSNVRNTNQQVQKQLSNSTNVNNKIANISTTSKTIDYQTYNEENPTFFI